MIKLWLIKSSVTRMGHYLPFLVNKGALFANNGTLLVNNKKATLWVFIASTHFFYGM